MPDQSFLVTVGIVSGHPEEAPALALSYEEQLLTYRPESREMDVARIPFEEAATEGKRVATSRFMRQNDFT